MGKRTHQKIFQRLIKLFRSLFVSVREEVLLPDNNSDDMGTTMVTFSI